MAKIPAKDASIYVWDTSSASKTITGDSNTATLSISVETPEVTAFGDGTRQRLPSGLLDWELSVNGFYSTGTDSIAEVLRPLVGACTVVNFGPSGSSSGCILYTGCCICSEASFEFPVEGAATYSATFVARSGSLTSSSW